MTIKTFRIPNFRLPCLRQGELCNAPLSPSQGLPFILCCLPHLTEKEIWLLEAHAKEVEKSGKTFAVLLHRNFPSTESWVRPLYEFGFPIFVDPMKRLRRSLRLLHTLPLQRCESLIFDQDRLLQFRVFHHFNLRGLSTMLNIAKFDRVPLIHRPDNFSDMHLHRNTASRLSPVLPKHSQQIDPLSPAAPSNLSDICA